jgi:hypothetical protein
MMWLPKYVAARNHFGVICRCTPKFHVYCKVVLKLRGIGKKDGGQPEARQGATEAPGQTGFLGL